MKKIMLVIGREKVISESQESQLEQKESDILRFAMNLGDVNNQVSIACACEETQMLFSKMFVQSKCVITF